VKLRTIYESDENLRGSERARGENPSQYLNQLMRAGKISPEDLHGLVQLGQPGARELFGGDKYHAVNDPQAFVRGRRVEMSHDHLYGLVFGLVELAEQGYQKLVAAQAKNPSPSYYVPEALETCRTVLDHYTELRAAYSYYIDDVGNQDIEPITGTLPYGDVTITQMPGGGGDARPGDQGGTTRWDEHNADDPVFLGVRMLSSVLYYLDGPILHIGDNRPEMVAPEDIHQVVRYITPLVGRHAVNKMMMSVFYPQVRD
jgi:hypothetical protein